MRGSYRPRAGCMAGMNFVSTYYYYQGSESIFSSKQSSMRNQDKPVPERKQPEIDPAKEPPQVPTPPPTKVPPPKPEKEQPEIPSEIPDREIKRTPADPRTKPDNG